MRRFTRLGQRGFTLIEVLIATVITAGAVMVLASAWSGNFVRVKNARINNTMAGLLERKMTEYEVRAQEKPSDQLPEEEAGDFGPKFKGYRWEMKSQPFEMPDMSGALTSREGGADEMLLTLVRTSAEFFKDAVKELSVTVYFKGTAKGNEIRHSATTYLIDYTKEIQIPGMGAMPGGGAPAPGGTKK